MWAEQAERAKLAQQSITLVFPFASGFPGGRCVPPESALGKLASEAPVVRVIGPANGRAPYCGRLSLSPPPPPPRGLGERAACWLIVAAQQLIQ